MRHGKFRLWKVLMMEVNGHGSGETFRRIVIFTSSSRCRIILRLTSILLEVGGVLGGLRAAGGSFARLGRR